MKTKYKMMYALVIVALTLATLLPAQAGAQILTGDQLKKVIPTSFFYAGQVATVQARNSIGQKPDRYGAARYLPRG